LTSPSGFRVGPAVVLLPVGLLGAVVLFDLSVLLSGIDLVAEVGRWILGTGLVVGLLVLTAVLIELTATMSGTPEHRIRGAVGSGLAMMVVLFLFVWWARHDGTATDGVAIWLVEVLALAGGATASWFARDLGKSDRSHTGTHALGLGDL
jgi:uncharacterized membrane protein